MSMRRKDRQVFGDDLNDILKRAKVVRLAMVDGARPYIVPMNFGVEFFNGLPTLYFHCAPEGRKLDILSKDPRVCFEADGAHRLIKKGTACAYGFAYESVIGEGTAELIGDRVQKTDALMKIMAHQTGREDFEFPLDALDGVCVFKVIAGSVTGKRVGG